MSIPKGSKASQQFTTLPAELVAAIDNLSLTKGKTSLARLLCDRIINNFEENDLSFSHDYTPLPHEYLYKINKNYHDVLKPLKKAGIIEVLLNEDGKESYLAGSYCKCYRINPALITDNFVETSYTSTKGGTDTIDAETEAEIMDMQRRIKIDKTAADAYVKNMVDNLSINDYRIIHVEDIANDYIQVYYGTGKTPIGMPKHSALESAKRKNLELFYSNDKYIIDSPEEFIARKKISIAIAYARRNAKTARGIFPKPVKSATCDRVFHLFTSTANSMLQFHSVDSERIVSNDLSNSQFTILSYILKSIINNNINPDIWVILNDYNWEEVWDYIDVRTFEEDAELQSFVLNSESGKLYKYYQEKLGIKDIKTTKETMFSLVFSSHLNYSRQKMRLKQFAPFMSRLVDTFKKNNDIVDTEGNKEKGSLPLLLQRVEAYIFTERIYKALQAAGVWFMTKHDEILSKESDAARVKEIIENTLSEIGIKGVVKTDKNVKPDVENTVIVGDTNQSDVTNEDAEAVVADACSCGASSEPKSSLFQKLKRHLEGDHAFNEWMNLTVMPALI